MSPRVVDAKTTARPPLRVSVYGDSIGAELKQYLGFWLQLNRPTTIKWYVYGGTNACDWMKAAKLDAASSTAPQVVVTLFTGNAFTPCMNPNGTALTRLEVLDKTLADTDALSALFPKAQVYRVGMARSLGVQAKLDADPSVFSFVDNLNPLLQAHNEGHSNWHFVDGASALMVDGRAVMTMPCVFLDRGDPACQPGGSGQVTVRAPDGGHLCPVARAAVNGVLPGKGCPVYSPGANRLAITIFAALVRY